MYKGSFKTAYLQREVVDEAAVILPANDEKLAVGILVKLAETTVSDTTVKYVRPVALTDATHILAQSDMTLGYGHVPVEYRDYKYSPDVAGTKLATKFLGYYDASTDLPAAASGNNGFYAWVETDDCLYSSDGSAWTKQTGTIMVAGYETKQLAMFKITNKDDIEVVSVS